MYSSCDKCGRSLWTDRIPAICRGCARQLHTKELLRKYPGNNDFISTGSCVGDGEQELINKYGDVIGEIDFKELTIVVDEKYKLEAQSKFPGFELITT